MVSNAGWVLGYDLWAADPPCYVNEAAAVHALWVAGTLSEKEGEMPEAVVIKAGSPPGLA